MNGTQALNLLVEKAFKQHVDYFNPLLDFKKEHSIFFHILLQYIENTGEDTKNLIDCISFSDFIQYLKNNEILRTPLLCSKNNCNEIKKIACIPINEKGEVGNLCLM